MVKKPIFRYPFDKNQKIVEPDWQNYICETANVILKEQTPQNLLNVRSRLYELLCHGIPTELIFKVESHFLFTVDRLSRNYYSLYALKILVSAETIVDKV